VTEQRLGYGEGHVERCIEYQRYQGDLGAHDRNTE
jgi:hypothetical protein